MRVSADTHLGACMLLISRRELFSGRQRRVSLFSARFCSDPSRCHWVRRPGLRTPHVVRAARTVTLTVRGGSHEEDC